MAKEGSTVGGLMDAYGTCLSMALQYGVPLSTLVDKFSHARFEPAGMTSNRDIPFAKSLIDYIARWLGMTFLPGYREANAPKRNNPHPPDSVQTFWPRNGDHKPHDEAGSQTDAKPTSKPKLGQLSDRLGELIDIVNKSEPKPESDEDGRIMQNFNRQFSHFQADAPVCDVCGSITVRNGNCYRCHNCGASHGCS